MISATYSVSRLLLSFIHWGQGNAPFISANTLTKPNGYWVTCQKKRHHQLNKRVSQGDVSLTIENVSMGDSDHYCCSVRVLGLFRPFTTLWQPGPQEFQHHPVLLLLLCQHQHTHRATKQPGPQEFQHTLCPGSRRGVESLFPTVLQAGFLLLDLEQLEYFLFSCSLDSCPTDGNDMMTQFSHGHWRNSQSVFPAQNLLLIT